MILVGTNNVSHKAAEVAKGLLAIAQALRDKLSEAHIVLLVS